MNNDVQSKFKEELVISTCQFNLCSEDNEAKDNYRAMIYQGANVNLGPVQLARLLDLDIIPNVDGRTIGTADSDGVMVIIGWIFPRGYTGPIALVNNASYILLSVIQLQKNGMGVHCPPERTICLLTIICDDAEQVVMELEQLPPTNLYFDDIRMLLNDSCASPEQSTYDIDQQKQQLSCVGNVANERRTHKLTYDIISRVWKLHENLNHVSLMTLAYMVRMGTLKSCSCDEMEIYLVASHQDCVACLLAKAKAITEKPSSGVHDNIVGRSWSMDYQGPYSVEAIGGYTGRFLFTERSRGYLVSFLVKSKKEAFDCVSKVYHHNKRFGHVMQELQTDMGTVELSTNFQDQCHMINTTIDHSRGIEVNPVNLNMQKQNVVERYVQTHNNMFAALMADNDLLPASFWGLGVSAVTDTMNHVTNSLCTDGNTPAFYFEGRSTDLQYQFRVGYGKAVVCTRVSKMSGPKLLGTSRNEFGVCVGPGNMHNGAVWIYLPSRGTHALRLRYNVRQI